MQTRRCEMPSKYQIIKEMAAQEALSITSNTERFMAFLHTAANNYKYSYQEQFWSDGAVAQQNSHVNAKDVITIPR